MKRTTLLAALAVMLLPAAPAGAQTATRADYVAQVDAICVDMQKSHQRLADKTFRVETGDDGPEPELTPSEELRAIAPFLAKSFRITRRGFSAIAAIPPAPGDEAAVQQFSSALLSANRLTIRMVRAAKKGKVSPYKRLQKKVGRVVNRGSAGVRDFGFTSCFGD